MMKRTMFFIFGMIFFCGASVACADEALTAKLADKPIFEKLAQMSLSAIKNIRDMGSIYEVVAENKHNHQKRIFYVTKDEQYVIAGMVYDMDNQNITQARMQEVDRVDFSKLPLQDAIVTKKGSGAKKLVLFTDPDCPYCRMASDWLAKQDNYILYTFLFPLDQIHPKARAKSVSILCAQDKSAAMLAVISGKDASPLAKTNLPEDQCEKMLAKHTLVAQIAHTTAVPVFIKPDGRKISGFNQKALEDYLR